MGEGGRGGIKSTLMLMKGLKCRAAVSVLGYSDAHEKKHTPRKLNRLRTAAAPATSAADKKRLFQNGYFIVILAAFYVFFRRNAAFLDHPSGKC